MTAAPFATEHMTQAEHVNRARELMASADQWINLQSYYRADCCATLALVHFAASRMPGTMDDNPEPIATPINPKEHIGRAIAMMTGAEYWLASGNYAFADALAATSLSHFTAAKIIADENTQPLPIYDSLSNSEENGR